jgi:sarcosine oxidase subunit gamma
VADDVHVDRLEEFALASIMARSGIGADAVGAALGGRAPDGANMAQAGDITLLGVAPGTWLAHAARWTPDWETSLRNRLGGLASVSDQSSSYEIFRVQGSRACRLLQRSVAIDLDPAVFAPGRVAVSAIAHIGVTLWQLDDAPTYNIACFRSHAASFQQWLAMTIESGVPA